MTIKEYWRKAEQLRKRINRKIHEIYILRQRAEGMSCGETDSDSKTASPEHDKIGNAVCEIVTLEQEIKETQEEFDTLVAKMQNCIQQIENADARDLLTKRYVEFKPWKTVAAEFGYSESHTKKLHGVFLKKLILRDTQ